MHFTVECLRELIDSGLFALMLVKSILMLALTEFLDTFLDQMLFVSSSEWLDLPRVVHGPGRVRLTFSNSSLNNSYLVRTWPGLDMAQDMMA